MSGYLPTVGIDYRTWQRLVLEHFKAFRSFRVETRYFKTAKEAVIDGKKVSFGNRHEQDAPTKIERDLAGEQILDKSKRIVAEVVKEYFVNMGKKYYNLPAKTATEWVMTMEMLVSEGIIPKGFADTFLSYHFGPKAWRWFKRAIWFDDPVAAAMFMIESGVKTGGDLVKYVLSGLNSS